MYKEYDIVKTTKVISNLNIPIGTHGTIINIWNEQLVFVEFVINNKHYVEDLYISEIETI